MCGIIAWSGKTPRQFNTDKFNILGLFNNDRGGDSCGIASDGEIYYGVDKNKNFNDFIINKNYLKPTIVPTVIGHTRKVSVGIANIHNAHPFGYGNLNEGYEFIGCHNGTLMDYEELAKKYEVDITIYDEKGIYDRRKNDSEVLLEILYKTREINVLEDYIGGAAIVFQDLNEPNKIYTFHGASKKEIGDVSTILYEERPLYYYQESKNSLYISSIEEALVFIGGDIKKNVFEFEHNILYEITDGNIEKAVKIEINRTNSGQKKSYIYEKPANFSKGGVTHSTTKSHLTKSERRKLKTKSEITNIFYEKGFVNEFPSNIYYANLRYKRNGHNISGIYTWIKDYGFYKLTEESLEIPKITANLIARYFSFKRERFIADHEIDEMLKTNNELIIPFNLNQNPSIHYFHDGILLQTKEDYVVIKAQFKNFSFEELSQMSRYPIVRNIKCSDDYQNILYNGQKYSNSFTPIDSNNIYNIENGNLISIERIEEFKSEAEKSSINVAIQLPLKLNTCSLPAIPTVDLLKRPLQEFLNHQDLEEENEFIEEQKESERVVKIIDDSFLKIYNDMQTVHEILKNEPSEDIQLLIECGKEYLMSIDCITEQYEYK